MIFINTTLTPSPYSTDDVFMTDAHKLMLSTHREKIVSNMIPDDILNTLLAEKAVSTRDATRIKEKGLWGLRKRLERLRKRLEGVKKKVRGY